MQLAILCVALFIVACASSPPAPPPTLNAIAEDFVRLSLEIGTHEAGYVDAYYGPAEWKAQAEADPRATEELKAGADALSRQLAALPDAGLTADNARRRRFLAASLVTARFRLDMIEGARIPFADEAERLFALRPNLQPLAHYDEALARIEALLPGDGPLQARAQAFRDRYRVPPDRVRPVMDAAIAECRRRTLAHMNLPDNETFRMELVRDEPWGAYNWYQGNAESLIQINTDLPTYISSAVTLGCHEGYPGHHVQAMLAERMYRERGWVEFSILPLYAPQAPLNEGGAEFGIELAFPGDQRAAFERQTLYPLAGLDPQTAPAFDAYREATADLRGAGLTINAMFLDGEITHAEAVDLLQRYRLVTREEAEKSLQFAQAYRSYVINYVSGEDVVRAYVESQSTEDARWAAYVGIFSAPTIAADLTAH